MNMMGVHFSERTAQSNPPSHTYRPDSQDHHFEPEGDEMTLHITKVKDQSELPSSTTPRGLNTHTSAMLISLAEPHCNSSAITSSTNRMYL